MGKSNGQFKPSDILSQSTDVFNILGTILRLICCFVKIIH